MLPSAAIIRTGVNADSWVKLFNNLAAKKMRKINGVTMHINPFLIWISSLVCAHMCGDRGRKKGECFCLQPLMFMCEIKTDSNFGRKGGRAA